MRRIELVVFDMAGTTVRDKGNVAVAFMEACSHYGIEVPKEEVHKVMGFRKSDAVKILLDKFYTGPAERTGELTEQIHDRFTRSMVEFYRTDHALAPLPHAEEVFEWLHRQGVKVALNTGFTKAITDTILDRLQWNNNGVIDFVISSDEVPEGRPHPFMIEAIVKALGIAGNTQVMKVGDTEVDVEEGRNAGCGMVVGVTTGAYTRTELEQYRPDIIIDSLAELPSLIA